MRSLLATATLSAVFLMSCDKKGSSNAADDNATKVEQGGEPATAEADAETEAAAPEAPKVWADMNMDERKMHMGTVVWPHMKEKFIAFDADQFGDFKCQTCHGDDMTEVGFEMPNSVTPLDPADPWQSGVDMDEKTAKFMAEVVVPSLAEDLSMEVGPGEGQVGCFSCHLKAE